MPDRSTCTRAAARSQARCRFIQNSAVLPKNAASRSAVSAVADRELVNDLRVAAWATMPGRVTGEFTPGRDKPVTFTAPEGWPEGMGPEKALRAALGMGEADG